MSNHLAIATVTVVSQQPRPRRDPDAGPGSDVLLALKALAGGAALASGCPAVPLPGQPQHRAAQRRPARTECVR